MADLKQYQAECKCTSHTCCSTLEPLNNAPPPPYSEQHHHTRSYPVAYSVQHPQPTAATAYTNNAAVMPPATSISLPCGGRVAEKPIARQSSIRAAFSSVARAFRSLFVTEEELAVEDTLEQAILSESARLIQQEDDIARCEDDQDREERRIAWAHIDSLSNDFLKLTAIQAEMGRSANAYKLMSERLQERARQRSNATTEVMQYRKQRYLSALLKTICFAATATLALVTVRNMLVTSASRSVATNKSLITKTLATSPQPVTTTTSGPAQPSPPPPSPASPNGGGGRHYRSETGRDGEEHCWWSHRGCHKRSWS